jgi:asparagine synthase (glutamine-hydrolysing)
MCGIAGILERAPALAEAPLERTASEMAEALRHRGPDAGAVWCDPEQGVALGHRRLSILDLSPAGAQPMHSASGRYVISYNGELYDAPALSAELRGRGAVFRGHSDTEVLLAAIEAWGLDAALERSNGMFAFALWDRSERVLHLARDRVGKKPLYYGWFDGVFLFGSELAALRRHPRFDARLDPDALAGFLCTGWLAQPRSIYARCRMLPPASTLRVAAGGPESGPRPYWSAQTAALRGRDAPFAGDFAEAVDRLDRLLREAVSDRMLSDVPLGALLSGGIDSSAVVGAMQALSGQPVRTFTIGFEEPRFDESEFAARVATHLGTRHRELVVTAKDCLELVPRIPQIYDEPFADVSQIPTALVCRLAREDVTVVLTGDGGDETFAGYRHYFDALRDWRRLAGVPRSARAAAGRALAAAGRASWSLARPRRAVAKLPGWRRVGARLEHAVRGWSAESPADLLTLRYARYARPAALVPAAGAQRAGRGDASAAPLEPLRALMLCDYEGYLCNDILVKVDRASMAVGLEARCPLLDLRVAEFAWSLPDAFLVDARGGKRVLREVLARYVPAQLTERPKRGFGVPLGAWLRGPLREWAGDLLAEPALRREGLLRASEIRRIWEQHLCGWRDHGDLLWAILTFRSWHQATHPTA